MEALESVLLRVSEMVCELPWLKEMDINPLIVDETRRAGSRCARGGGLRASLQADRYAHMAIYPYPSHLVTNWQLPDGTEITIRPIRPEDAEMEQEFVRDLSDEAKYFRFMNTLQELTQTMLVRFTQIDYDREMALIAVTEESGKEVEIGRRPLRHQPRRRILRIRPGGRRPVAAQGDRPQADGQPDGRGARQGPENHGRRSAGKQPQHAQAGCDARFRHRHQRGRSGHQAGEP